MTTATTNEIPRMIMDYTSIARMIQHKARNLKELISFKYINTDFEYIVTHHLPILWLAYATHSDLDKAFKNGFIYLIEQCLIAIHWYKETPKFKNDTLRFMKSQDEPPIMNYPFGSRFTANTKNLDIDRLMIRSGYSGFLGNAPLKYALENSDFKRIIFFLENNIGDTSKLYFPIYTLLSNANEEQTSDPDLVWIVKYLISTKKERESEEDLLLYLKDNPKLLEFLVDSGVNPNYYCENTKTSVLYNMIARDRPYRLIEALLKKGGRLCRSQSIDHNPTELQVANYVDDYYKVELFLKYGFPIGNSLKIIVEKTNEIDERNKRNEKGIRIIKLLLANGGDIAMIYRNGRNIFFYVECLSVFYILLEEMKRLKLDLLNIQDNDGERPLNFIQSRGQPNLFREFINNGALFGDIRVYGRTGEKYTDIRHLSKNGLKSLIMIKFKINNFDKIEGKGNKWNSLAKYYKELEKNNEE